MKVVIAIAIGLVMGIADAIAHDHPPPKTCAERCAHVQCQCVEACKAAGHDEPFNPMGASNCKGDCYFDRLACDASCRVPRLSLRGARP